MTEQYKNTISKFLSLILRHQPEKIDLVLDENGWTDVEELIQKASKNKMKFSFEELGIVVDTNEKKRFAFNENKTKIRASQGHSIEIDLLLEPIVPPNFLYHGTAEKFLDSILGNGIKKMNRQHVHLSGDVETAMKVGSRHGKVIVLTILTEKMHEDGINFYKSENGVWLTDFIDAKYISK